MNILSLFVVIPLIMMVIVFCLKSKDAIRLVMAAGSLAILGVSAYLTTEFLSLRAAGDTSEFLFTDSYVWYETFNIHYAIGVDGISVAMLLLSSVVVITGVFASWGMNDHTKEYFLWSLMLSIGVFGFFISLALFTMFLFYEVAIIQMSLWLCLW